MICAKCGKQLSEGASFCTACGTKSGGGLPPLQWETKVNRQASWSQTMTKKRFSMSGKKTLLLGVVTLVVLFFILLNTNMAFRCKILKHQWQEATCEHPKACNVCGKTEGEKASHQWQEATFYDPETCIVCGLAEGDPFRGIEAQKLVADEFVKTFYSFNISDMLAYDWTARYPGTTGESIKEIAFDGLDEEELKEMQEEMQDIKVSWKKINVEEMIQETLEYCAAKISEMSGMAGETAEITGGSIIKYEMTAQSDDVVLPTEEAVLIVLECNGKIGVWGVEGSEETTYFWDY